MWNWKLTVLLIQSKTSWKQSERRWYCSVCCWNSTEVRGVKVEVLGLLRPSFLRVEGSALEGAPFPYTTDFVKNKERIKNDKDIHQLNSDSTSRNVRQGTLLFLRNLLDSCSLDTPPSETPKDVHEGFEEDQDRPITKFHHWYPWLVSVFC